jgi:hypothetical protein
MNRRGLSETVAVLALIVVAVAIAVFLGIFSSAFTRNVAVSERIDVSASLKTLYGGGGAAVLRVSVKNVGDTNIRLISISVTGGSAFCSSTSLPSVAPGQVVELVLDCTGVAKYSKYVVAVRGQTPAGNQIETQVPVTTE